MAEPLAPSPSRTYSLRSLVQLGAMQRLLAFGALILLLVVFSLASPNFFQFDNLLAPGGFVDALSGNAAVNGIPVEVTRA